jgi:16S rRNA processing protein RimM
VPPATNGDPAPINVNHGKEVAGGVILKFQGCTTRDAAVLLKGFEIAVNRADLPAPEEEEFYQTDLLNLLAITDTGESLGHVSYLMENGPSLVLVIQNESGKESLVPFTEEFVPKVDLDAGTLVVSAIPGLLD